MENAVKLSEYDYTLQEGDDFDLMDLDAEEVDPVEVLEKEVQRQKSELELMAKLKFKQTILGIVKCANRAKEEGARVGKILKEVKEKAQEYEKDYIAEKTAIDDYEKRIEELKSNHKRGVEIRVAKKMDYEKEEREAMDKKSAAKNGMERMKATDEFQEYLHRLQELKDEFSQAVLDGDSEKEQIKRAELLLFAKRDPRIPYKNEMKEADVLIAEAREKISEVEEELGVWDETRNELWNEIEADKNKAFSGLVKQNFWQKLVGSVLNKFTRANKFKNNVFGQIKNLTAKLIESGEHMMEKYEAWEDAQNQAKAAREQERKDIKDKKAKERENIKAQKDQAKAAKAEEKQKQKAESRKSLEDRLAETEKQLKSAKAQYNGKNLTPALEGVNGNIVQFDGRD